MGDSVAQPILLEFLLWECPTMAAFNFNVTLHENIKHTTFSDWLFHEANNLSWQEIEEIRNWSMNTFDTYVGCLFEKSRYCWCKDKGWRDGSLECTLHNGLRYNNNNVNRSQSRVHSANCEC